MASPVSVAVVVMKPSPDAKLGIGFSVNNVAKRLKVSSICPNGLFAESSLKVGMIVDTINGKKCAIPTEAAAMLRSAEREVKIEAHDDPISIIMASLASVVVVVMKPSPDAKLGISFSSVGERIKVSSISPNGLFAESSLKEGMVVDTVNGKKCATPTEAAAMLRSAEREVKIEAHDDPIQDLFKELVTQEFGREFNIRWHANDWRGGKKCTIKYKNNADDLTALFCPSAMQQYVYTLTLLDEGRVKIVDDMARTLTRRQGGYADPIIGVRRSVGRIENQLMMHEHQSKVPVATAFTAPQG